MRTVTEHIQIYIIIFLSLAAVLLLIWYLLRVCERAHGADWGNPWFNRLDGLNRIFCRRFHRLDHEPLHLPDTGGAIVVANHISGLDPLLMVAASRRPLRFLIAHEQYDRFGLKWLYRAAGCIPVERENRPERAFKEALKALAQGEIVALFPQGGIHLPEHPPKRLKTGAARLSYLSGCPIYPAHIEGVRGAGKVVLAVFIPSRPRLFSYDPVTCAREQSRECLEHIQALIERPPGLVSSQS